MNHSTEILSEVKKAVSGKDSALLWILVTVLSGGHVLLEDIPGVGKTTIALAFSRALGLRYGRVQFTPDVLPSDITGYSVYNRDTGELSYRPGAVMCNLFLADELNRATSRTQSALLEAMEEGQVTVDGVSRPLPRPFIVFATQNPVGAAGTQLLPDSQIDRFSVKLSVGYPDADAEYNMVASRLERNPLTDVREVVSAETLTQMMREAGAVYINEDVIRYIVALVSATRTARHVALGASPRATLAVTNMAKSLAYVQGRDYVTPKDVKTVLYRTLAHRLQIEPTAPSSVTARGILDGISSSVPAPKV